VLGLMGGAEMTNEERKERNLESWINARATLGETREEAIAKWHKQLGVQCSSIA
jgi:hypothetical protein